MAIKKLNCPYCLGKKSKVYDLKANPLYCKHCWTCCQCEMLGCDNDYKHGKSKSTQHQWGFPSDDDNHLQQSAFASDSSQQLSSDDEQIMTSYEEAKLRYEAKLLGPPDDIIVHVPAGVTPADYLGTPADYLGGSPKKTIYKSAAYMARMAESFMYPVQPTKEPQICITTYQLTHQHIVTESIKGTLVMDHGFSQGFSADDQGNIILSIPNRSGYTKGYQAHIGSVRVDEGLFFLGHMEDVKNFSPRVTIQYNYHPTKGNYHPTKEKPKKQEQESNTTARKWIVTWKSSSKKSIYLTPADWNLSHTMNCMVGKVLRQNLQRIRSVTDSGLCVAQPKDLINNKPILDH